MRLLITGATGLIGRRITQLCLKKDIPISYLTTSKNKIEHREDYKGFYWNPSKGEIDANCLEGVGTIINLAGESIFQPWTKKNKTRILNSRKQALGLLKKLLEKNEHHVGQLISASGVDAYPASKDKMNYEDNEEFNQNFLGKVVQQWEESAQEFKALGVRVAIMRIGLVLSRDGGALPQMSRPFRFNIGTSLGSGEQWQSWIHIHDLARMFVFVTEQGLTGIYNAVAPNPVIHEELIRQIARVMKKDLWLPKVPGFLLRTVMGEMSSLVLEGRLVSSKKIEDAGFNFFYVNLDRAFEDLFNKKAGAMPAS